MLDLSLIEQNIYSVTQMSLTYYTGFTLTIIYLLGPDLGSRRRKFFVSSVLFSDRGVLQQFWDYTDPEDTDIE